MAAQNYNYTGSSNSTSGLTPKQIRKIVVASIAIFAVLVAILIFFGGMFRVVGVGEIGILTNLGNIQGERQSGVVIKAPWQGLTIMDIKTQKEEQDASAATKDLQTVTSKIAVNYHLTPDTAKKVFQTVGEGYVNVVIDPIIQEAVKSITSQYNAEELISQRPAVETALSDRLVSKLTDRGITIDNISITNFQFSAAFDAAIEQKQVAQQNSQKAAYELQTAQQKAQAQDVQAKTLTPEYLELQAIEKWDGKLPQTVAGGTGTVFNIPLNQ